MSPDVSKGAPREWHGAHIAWDYRPEAFRWDGEKIVGINFVSFAGDMRAWLQQKGQLALTSEEDLKTIGGYTNPHTFHAGSLALITTKVVNDFYAYATTPTVGENEIDAEIERLRIHNEVVLHIARFSEVVIKQLLYCTVIPESRYKSMALGALLESPCPLCKKQNGKTPHSVSMVGSLAHPFHLCLQFDHCAMEHMNLVNKLRNAQAAHSENPPLNIRTVEESKAQLLNDCTDLLSGFVHMLSHVEDLEIRMLDDLAKKGQAIILLRMNGLAAENCNFTLTPGKPFKYDAAFVEKNP